MGGVHFVAPVAHGENVLPRRGIFNSDAVDFVPGEPSALGGNGNFDCISDGVGVGAVDGLDNVLRREREAVVDFQANGVGLGILDECDRAGRNVYQ